VKWGLGRHMETRNKAWQENIAPVAARFRMGAVFGGGSSFDAKGSEAIADLLGDMAIKLDLSADMIHDLSREIASLNDKLIKVTSEGNDV